MKVPPPIIQGSALEVLQTDESMLALLSLSKHFHVVNPPSACYEFETTHVVIHNNTPDEQDLLIQTLQRCVYRPNYGVEEACFEEPHLIAPRRAIRIQFLHSCDFDLEISNRGVIFRVKPIRGRENGYHLGERFPPAPPRPKPDECCTVL